MAGRATSAGRGIPPFSSTADFKLGYFCTFPVMGTSFATPPGLSPARTAGRPGRPGQPPFGSVSPRSARSTPDRPGQPPFDSVSPRSTRSSPRSAQSALPRRCVTPTWTHVADCYLVFSQGVHPVNLKNCVSEARPCGSSAVPGGDALTPPRGDILRSHLRATRSRVNGNERASHAARAGLSEPRRLPAMRGE